MRIHTTTFRPQPPRRLRASLPGAYTLAELMIAIGILGIGMAMSAALFPLGLRENLESVRLTVGAMVVDNGLAVSQMALRQGGVGDSNAPTIQMYNVLTPLLQSSTCRNFIAQYPMVDSGAIDPNNRYGFITLGRNTNAEKSATYTPTSPTSQNQLVVVAYERMGTVGNTVVACAKTINGTAIQYTIDSTDYSTSSAYYVTPRFTTNSPIDLPPGTVIIDANTGLYAQVATYKKGLANSGTGTLDRRPSYKYYPINASFYTLVEADSSGNNPRTLAPIGVRTATVYLAP